MPGGRRPDSWRPAMSSWASALSGSRPLGKAGRFWRRYDRALLGRRRGASWTPGAILNRWMPRSDPRPPVGLAFDLIDQLGLTIKIHGARGGLAALLRGSPPSHLLGEPRIVLLGMGFEAGLVLPVEEVVRTFDLLDLPFDIFFLLAVPEPVLDVLGGAVEGELEGTAARVVVVVLDRPGLVDRSSSLLGRFGVSPGALDMVSPVP